MSKHPREHSLALASADTLHKGGYISTAHRDRIRKVAGKGLEAHKAAKEMASTQTFGSLAPLAAPVDEDKDGM